MNNLNPAFKTAGADILVMAKPTKHADDMFIVTGRGTEKAVEFLNDTFRRAVRGNVADIHFQTTDRICRVRIRIPGGDLSTIHQIEHDWMRTIDDKIRSRGRISTTDRRSPHDGRISLTIDGSDIDVRISVTPGVGDGQLIVCRILNQSNSHKRLDDIQMTAPAREVFSRIITEPNGLFLITGPTGSGKTTTLYAMLNELNDGRRNIITVEDPVEYRIPDFHQINVDNDFVTFPTALRAVLRQDPDVIMIGEIRDSETANIAVQAAITGHLVLSTLHANNSPVAIKRMLDLGVDPMTLSTALRCVTAQRLVRTINPNANISMTAPTEAEQSWLKGHKINRPNSVYPHIENPLADYLGYAPVMEIVVADNRVKKVLEKGEAAIYAAASRQAQFETLAQAAERLAHDGHTTLGEGRRIVSVQDAPEIPNKRLGEMLVKSGKITEQILNELLTKQARSRMEGKHKKLGKMVVEAGYCTEQEIIERVGFTAEAVDILRSICQSETARGKLADLTGRWMPGATSLFDMAIENELITQEDLEHVQDY